MNTAFVEDWLKGKTAEDFAIIEHLGGRLLWPTKLQRLRADKKFHEEPACLQVLDPLDLLEATQNAMSIFSERGLDPKDERVQPLWAEIEVFAQVAIALREAKPGPDGNHAPKHSLGILLSVKETGIPRLQILNLHAQLHVFAKFEDPRLETLDTRTVIATAMAIAEVGNCSPLVAIAGSELDGYVIESARILRGSLLHESSASSQTSSTTERSRRKN
jgi:hypothetical protein